MDGAAGGAQGEKKEGAGRPSEATGSVWAHPSLVADEVARVAGDVARLVDSTLLKPTTSRRDVERLCAEAATLGFRSVCIPPCYVSLARDVLAGSTPLVCTVIGFPNGYATTASKAAETAEAVADGADEIDYVQNAAWVKDGRWDLLESESRAVVLAARGRLVKVILETSLLEPAEIALCATLHARAGVHVIKTSTGFGVRGATPGDVSTIATALAGVTASSGTCYGIKASGGVRTREDALAYVALGVTRIGTSGGLALLGPGGAAPAGTAGDTY